MVSSAKPQSFDEQFDTLLDRIEALLDHHDENEDGEFDFEKLADMLAVLTALLRSYVRVPKETPA